MYMHANVESLHAWHSAGKRGVWLKIPTEKAALIPVALKPQGDHALQIHHAKPEYVMLTCWLPKGEKNPLPLYATHSLGVGGFVEHSDGDGRVLFIKEAKGHYKDWKLPGGALDPGETLAEAVVREVREETGIKCEFVELLSFTHHHGFRFGCGDIYFVARCRALTQDIKPDPSEIAEAAWLQPEVAMSSSGARGNEHNQRILEVARYLADKEDNDKIVPVHIMKEKRPHARAMFYSRTPLNGHTPVQWDGEGNSAQGGQDDQFE
eukprot:TRINITY_DN4702_c0_g1_i2.p1 TRINITY_DN4702_c0_g1~~TRINITY_DN4702_c0_g1_i2.p1  ORF type:complete len:265 (+),score=43.35 TRINITY_DN4702_c0_g1_i2:590-1384(+)